MEIRKALKIIDELINDYLPQEDKDALNMARDAMFYMEKSVQAAKQRNIETSCVVRDFESEWQRQMEINQVLNKENEELKQALIKVAMKL